VARIERCHETAREPQPDHAVPAAELASREAVVDAAPCRYLPLRAPPNRKSALRRRSAAPALPCKRMPTDED
jgi:hypothetical protein